MNISELEKKVNFNPAFTFKDEKSEWQGFKYNINIGNESFNYTMGTAHFTPRYKKNSFTRNIVQKHTIDRRTGKKTIIERNKNKRFISDLGGWLHFPTFKDVMYSLISDMTFGEMSFSNFCDELGYSYDSIKDLETHRACEQNNKKIRSIFSNEEITFLQKELEDY